MKVKEALSALWTPRSTFNRAFNASETFIGLDGSKYYTWPAVRRQKINKLTLDVIHITIFLVGACTFGSGQHSYKANEAKDSQVGNDQPKYGIVYHGAIVVWWALGLVIALVVGLLWFPLLKWIPAPTSSRTVTATVTDENGVSRTITKQTSGGVMHYMELANKYMFTGMAYLRVLEFIYHLYETILHVNPRPVPTSSSTPGAVDFRKTWLARLGLVAGMFMGIGLGALVMTLWYFLELVHVTWLEYALIIVPAQLTVGIALASVLQVVFEKGQPLPTTKGFFEADANGQLTLEGLRQAFSFLVNSEIDMKALHNIATGKDKDKKDECEVHKDEKIGEIKDSKA